MRLRLVTHLPLASARATSSPGLAADIAEVGHFLAAMIDNLGQLVLVEVIERERDRPVIVDDESDRAMGAADPAGDLRGVGDRCGEADQLDVIRAEDDRFFPGRAALWIGEVMDLVEDHGLDVVQLPRALEEHVPQDLGGHDDDAGVTVLADVTGQEADIVAVDRAEVAELLVRQGLDGRGVDDAAGAAEGIVDAKLGDDRLPGAGRGSDHDRISAQQRADRLPLEGIEREGVERAELVDRVADVLG